MTAEPAVPPLRVLAWELTRACPLACKHCRAEALRAPPPGELDHAEALALIDDLAGMGGAARSRPEAAHPGHPRAGGAMPGRTAMAPILILTGGEPMLRPDFWQLAEHGHRRGLVVVAAPCGAYVDRAAAERMRQVGIAGISLSIDSTTAAGHDAFRGWDGAFAMVTGAAAAAREAGLPFQVNSTIHAGNHHELEGLAALARRLGAAKWDVFLLVPTGRARQLRGRELTARLYEDALLRVRAEAERGDLPVKVTCAPHSMRVFAEDGREPRALGATPCLGGSAFAFVSSTGQVQICGFLDLPAGNLRERPLSAIWRDSPLFLAMRDRAGYHGKCGVCDHRDHCGGCRARAYAVGGDELGAEPYCSYNG